MSKRNLTLLIILVVIAGLAVFAYFYFGKPATTPSGSTSGDTDTNFFSNFFPSKGANTGNPNDTTSEGPTDEPYIISTNSEEEVAKLRKVSSFPVAGYGLFKKERFVDVPKVEPTEETPAEEAPKTKKGVTAPKPTAPLTEFVTAVRYVEKSTGNVYQTFADKIKEQKFSTTLVPTIHEALFASNGENVLMRYLKLDGNTIATFAGVLDKEILGADSASSVEVKGTFLPENITDLSVSGDGSKIFYLTNIKDSAVGIVSSPDGSKKSQVFDSAFTEWISQFPNNNMVTLTTKASSEVPGYMYYINVGRVNLNKILGGINGLTTLTSPDGKFVLYGNNNLSLSIYNTTTKKASSLNLRTLPEKCTWTEDSATIYCATPKIAPTGSYPDDWYQGEVEFSDDIWKIDVESNVAGIILNSNDLKEGEEIDGIKLAVQDNYLFFVNKKDSYLWEFNAR